MSRCEYKNNAGEQCTSIEENRSWCGTCDTMLCDLHNYTHHCRSCSCCQDGSCGSGFEGAPNADWLHDPSEKDREEFEDPKRRELWSRLDQYPNDEIACRVRGLEDECFKPLIGFSCSDPKQEAILSLLDKMNLIRDREKYPTNFYHVVMGTGDQFYDQIISELGIEFSPITYTRETGEWGDYLKPHYTWPS